MKPLLTLTTTSRRPTLHMPGARPALPYAVEDARFATFALAQAYAAFRAEESGHTVTGGLRRAGVRAMNPRATKRYGVLMRARIEVGTGKPGYRWVDGWRIADSTGRDMVQPYFRTKRAARETAAELGIEIVGEQP